MNKNNKKGFTLTELVIVIVIIAILAAVLIPTYTGLVNRVKDSNDTNLVKLLNDALINAEVEEQPENMQDAIEVLDEVGYKVPSLQAKASKNTLVWNQLTNRFYIYSEGKVDVRDAAPDPTKYTCTINGVKKSYDLTDEDYLYTFWVISDTVNETFSTYYTGTGETINTSKGFDAGSTTSVKTINYTNDGNEQDVVIRSNGGTVSVKAPLDQVKHYGSATEVKITSVSQTSYYEYGKTTFVDIKNGRLVITNDKEAEVGTIYLSATSDAYNNITLATMSGAELPAVVQREAVTITSEKKLVATVQQVSDTGVEDTSKTEHIYLYAASTAYENTKGYSNVSDLGELVLEAPTGVSSFEITLENGNKETVTVSSLPDEVKETKTSTASEAKQGAQSRAICVDEENKIYELATADDLKLFASLVNGGQNFAGCTVKLTADIDLNNEDWTPIGNSATNYFAGVFDGQGHEIKNLKIVGHHHLGLFGYASGNDYDYSRDDVYNQTTNIFSETPITESHFTCVIKNFTIKNAKVEANDALTSNGAIKNTRSHSGIVLGEGGCVYVSNISIKSGSIKGQKYYGGVVGIIQKGVIKNCSLDADSSVTAQTGEYGHAGGILGAVLMSSESEVLSFYSSNTEASNCHVTIYDCTNDANITLNYGFAAGIISLSNGSNTLVYNCTNNGKISVSAGSTAMQIGGVFGNSQSGAVIVNCTNNGDVTGSSTYASQNHVAGICSNWANIINCVNNGEISGSSLYMAGICAVASSGAQLYGCTNNGTISNTSTMAGAKTSDLTTTGANKMSFASLGELQAHIDALTGSESLEVTNTTALSGTLKLNKFITTLKSNVKICDFLDIDNIGNYCNINIPNSSITISGDRSSANYTFSGNGTSITLASDVTLKHLSLNAAKDTAITFINNGTVSTRIDMNGLGTINVTNNGTLNSGISMWGTGTANITNNAGATITSGWHSVHTEAACTMNVYNHGTIATTGQGSCFAMLFYNGCTVDAYMYDGSDVKGGNILAPYSANKVTLHYKSGAKINGTAGAWAGRSDSKTTYTTNMD